MNQTFDKSRFCNYFAYFIKTGVKRQGVILLTLLGVVLCIVMMNAGVFDTGEYIYKYDISVEDPMHGYLWANFMFSFLLISSISASMMFSDLGDKPSRLDALMLPASALEKYLTRWLVFVPLTALACIIGFEIIDLLRVAFLSVKYPGSVNIHFLDMPEASSDVKKFVCAYLSIWSLSVAVFSLGAIVWPKLSLVKTFGAMFLLNVINSWWMVFLLSTLTDSRYDYFTVSDYDISGETFAYLVLAASLVVSLIMYVIAYLRLKEIELVQRW